MNSPRCPYLRARRAASFVALAGVVLWIILLSCSSDPPTTLGSDSDLLGSEPGEVFQDTIGVFDDATYAFKTPIATDAFLEVGVDPLYEHIMVLQPGFADLTDHPGDTLRTVQTASVHLATGGVGGSFPVRFYALGYKYTEGDTLIGFDHLTDADAIEDTLAGTIERHLEAASQVYPIPASLAQRWIRYPKQREAIAITYTDPGNVRVGKIPSQDNTKDHPYLLVFFTDGVQRSYDIRDDATAYRPLTTTENLIVSDGYPRRVFFRAELDSLAKDAAVHTALMRFHVVPGTIPTDSTELLLYIPDSTLVSAPAFKTGQRITERTVFDGDETVEFRLTNAIFLILQGTLKDNGFAIRCKDENTRLRQVELYGSDAAENLRPRVFVTSSTPAVFH